MVISIYSSSSRYYNILCVRKHILWRSMECCLRNNDLWCFENNTNLISKQIIKESSIRILFGQHGKILLHVIWSSISAITTYAIFNNLHVTLYVILFSLRAMSLLAVEFDEQVNRISYWHHHKANKMQNIYVLYAFLSNICVCE